MTNDEIRSILAELDAAAQSDASEKQALTAEIAALARWAARNIPAVFRRPAALITDQPGYYDSSYPPDGHVARRHRTPMLRVWDSHSIEEPTSSGFYYGYGLSPDTDGLLIGRDGTMYAERESGTAAVGQYAAYPGICDRHIEYDIRPLVSPGLDAIRAAAKLLGRIRAAYLDPATELAARSGDADVELAAATAPNATPDQLRALVSYAHRGAQTTARGRLELEKAAQA